MSIGSDVSEIADVTGLVNLVTVGLVVRVDCITRLEMTHGSLSSYKYPVQLDIQ